MMMGKIQPASGVTLSSLESKVSSWNVRDLCGCLEVLAGKEAIVCEGRSSVSPFLSGVCL